MELNGNIVDGRQARSCCDCGAIVWIDEAVSRHKQQVQCPAHEEIHLLKSRIVQLEHSLRLKVYEMRSAINLTAEQWASVAQYWENMAYIWYQPRHWQCAAESMPGSIAEMDRAHSAPQYCGKCYGTAISSAREGWEDAIRSKHKAA